MIVPRARYEGAARKHFSWFLGDSLLCWRTVVLIAEPRVGMVRYRQAPGSELKERIFEKRRKSLKNPMSRLQELRSTVPFKSNWKAICLTCYFISCPVCILSVCIQKQEANPYFPVWICHQGCPAWMLGQLAYAALAPLLQKWAWGSQCTEQTAECHSLGFVHLCVADMGITYEDKKGRTWTTGMF